MSADDAITHFPLAFFVAAHYFSALADFILVAFYHYKSQ